MTTETRIAICANCWDAQNPNHPCPRPDPSDRCTCEKCQAGAICVECEVLALDVVYVDLPSAASLPAYRNRTREETP